MAEANPAITAPEGEVWRPIPGYEGLYQVSNRGRVWSSWRGGRLLKAVHAGRPGYLRLRVILCNGETRRQVGVHQLVMLAFVGPCPPGMEVLHNDGNEYRNWWPENLRYGTHKENQQDMVRHGRAMGCGKLGSEHPKAKLTEDLVRQIRCEYAAGGVTERDLSARHGVNVSTLHRLLVRKTWTHVE